MPTPSIHVIIPVYGNWSDTIACLESLRSQSATNFQIHIADDGSPEPPPDRIQGLEGVQYVRGENVGFGANCNRAARRAIAQGATHLLFLNSDTIVSEGFMSRWMVRASEMPDAILGPLVYWATEPDQIWSSGGKLSVFTPFVRSRRSFGQVTEVDTIVGCAVLVPTKAWQELEGFSARYFMYFEDFDLTLRAKERGIRTYIVPDRELRVLHHVSGSFRGEGAWRKYNLMLESTLIFVRCHYSGVRKLICLGLGAAHFVMTFARSLPALPRLKPLGKALARGFEPMD